MPSTKTPLRYPGGKAKLYPTIRPLIHANVGRGNGTYIEPYAGGAGLALALLFNGDVGEIVLNDIDIAIFSFWNCCLQDTTALCTLIANVQINMDTWYMQRDIYEHPWLHTQLEIAFAAFIMNRCNISGVMRGGPIGGKEQNGNYMLDARFNRDDLIRKIQRVGANRDRIHVYNRNASRFLMEDLHAYDLERTILNIDPPYVKKGPLLYENSYEEADHAELADIICGLNHKWIVTYDECPLVYELYQNFRKRVITLNYSVGNDKCGKELIIFSNRIQLLDEQMMDA